MNTQNSDLTQKTAIQSQLSQRLTMSSYLFHSIQWSLSDLSVKYSMKLTGTKMITGTSLSINSLTRPNLNGNVFQTKKKYQNSKVSYKPTCIELEITTKSSDQCSSKVALTDSASELRSEYISAKITPHDSPISAKIKKRNAAILYPRVWGVTNYSRFIFFI